MFRVTITKWFYKNVDKNLLAWWQSKYQKKIVEIDHGSFHNQC